MGTFCPRPASTSKGWGGWLGNSGRGRGQVQQRGRLWGSKSGSRSMPAAASLAEFSFPGSIRGLAPLQLCAQSSPPQTLTMPPLRGEAPRVARRIPASPQEVADFPLAPGGWPPSRPLQCQSALRDTTCNLRRAKALFLQALTQLPALLNPRRRSPSHIALPSPNVSLAVGPSPLRLQPPGHSSRIPSTPIAALYFGPIPPVQWKEFRT